jgi:hypothetical protein
LIVHLKCGIQIQVTLLYESPYNSVSPDMDLADCLYHRLFARPPSQTEVADLAKTALKKYLSSLIKFRAHMEAENQSMRNGAYAMLDALRSTEPRCNAT